MNKNMPALGGCAWGAKKILLIGLIVFTSFIYSFSIYAESGITYGPYVQNISKLRATVLLKTDSETALTLYYKKDDGKKWKKITDASPMQTHRYRLLGLRAGHSYDYYFSNGDDLLTQTYTFETSHKINSDNPLNIAAVGDFSVLNTDQLRVITQIMRLDPDMVLGLGDCAYTYGTLDELINIFFKPFQALIAEVPLYSTMGNHDYLTEEGGPYKEVFEFPTKSSGTEDYYAFTYDNTRIISLNANLDYAVGSDMYEWFKTELMNSTEKWKIVIIHKPPYSSGGHGSTVDMHDTLVPLFDEYKVDLVLSGHDHIYERSQDDSGVVYIVSGGGGSPLYDKVHENEFSDFFLSEFHFTNLLVYKNRIEIKGIDKRGYIFDTLTIEKQG